MNVPDRSGPNTIVLPDPELMGVDFVAPFYVVAKGPYIHLAPKVTIGGAGTEVTFIAPCEWKDENRAGTNSSSNDYNTGACNILMGEIVGKHALLTPLGYYVYAGGDYTQMPSPTHCQGVDPLIAGATYRWVFDAPTKDEFRTTLYRVGKDTAIGTWSIEVTDIFAGEPDVRIGFPSAAHLAARYGVSNSKYGPVDEFVITGMRGL